MAVWMRRAKGIHEAHVSTKQPTTQENARLSRADGYSGRAAGHQAAAGQGTQAADRHHSAEAAALSEPAASATGRQKFPRSHRLRKRPEFLALQREGRRRTVTHFIVITRGKDRAPSRLGITTSRKVGDAPERNRVRRLVREFFRHRQTAFALPRDVLVIARPGAADLQYRDVERELTAALGLDRTDG